MLDIDAKTELAVLSDILLESLKWNITDPEDNRVQLEVESRIRKLTAPVNIEEPTAENTAYERKKLSMAKSQRKKRLAEWLEKHGFKFVDAVDPKNEAMLQVYIDDVFVAELHADDTRLHAAEVLHVKE